MTAKTCKTCKKKKSPEAFRPMPGMRDGLRSFCRACENLKAAEYRIRKRAEPTYKATYRIYNARSKARIYGTTLEHILELEAKYSGPCDICGLPPKCRNGGRADSSLHIDHCHATGKIRGLLCSDCNRAIGLFRDDPEVVARAAAYLCKP